MCNNANMLNGMDQCCKQVKCYYKQLLTGKGTLCKATCQKAHSCLPNRLPIENNEKKESKYIQQIS